MKRLVICCDGTWQSLDSAWPTNVQRISQFVLPSAQRDTDGDQNSDVETRITQTVYYDAGVGQRTPLDRITGGAFGAGLNAEIREAYRFLSLNFEPGDEIYLFGFSRGAYTVRSLAGLIYCCGIVARSKLRAIPRAMELYRDREIKPSEDECVNFRTTNAIQEDGKPPAITFLGCWDTVGALGVPDAIPFIPFDDWMGEKYEFHDLNLGRHVKHARHAVAIDERRRMFDITPMCEPENPEPGHTLKQIWFAGNHSAVGGGTRHTRGLADIALTWMIDEAAEIGLEFDQQEIEKFTSSDALADFEMRDEWLRDKVFSHNRDGPKTRETVSAATLERWHKMDPPYRPKTLGNAMKTV